MADNILTKDRANANLDIAAKDITGVLFPRNILATPAGVDLSPLTDAELRNSPVPVSVPSLPLPPDAATQTTLAAILSALGSPVQAGGTVPVTGTFWQATQPVSLASAPLPAGAATDAGLASIYTVLGSPMQMSGGSVAVAGAVAVTGSFWQATQPVSAASLPLPTGAASEATLDARTGSLTETVPATDTASAGINGRLQRIAQRLTSLIGLLPESLGPKPGAASLSVVESTPTTVTIVSLQTSATGASYVAFGSQACEQLDLVNTAPAAVDLEVRRGGTGNTITVPAGSSRMFIGLANASDLQLRRLDQSNVQVTFTAEAIKQ